MNHKDLGLKVFALIIAGLLAFYVHSESNNSQSSYVASVEVTGVPDRKIIIEPLGLQAKVTVRGPRFLVSPILQSQPGIRVRVPSDVDKSFLATLARDNIELPPGVQLVAIDPPEFQVRLDQLVTRELPVVVPQIGHLRKGLVLNRFAVSPERITVQGPEREVSSLIQVETKAVDLRSVTESASLDLSLRSPGNLITTTQSQIRVAMDVVVQASEKKFDQLAIELRSSTGKVLVINPTKVSVEVSGPRDIVAALNRDQIIPYVRLGGEEADGSDLKVGVDLPSGIQLVVVEPAAVRVRHSEAARGVKKGVVGSKK